MRENAFLKVDDLKKKLKVYRTTSGPKTCTRYWTSWPHDTSRFTQKYGLIYRWSIMQVEYATDIAFKKQADLRPLYETLVRTAIHSVKPENIASLP
jgi:hypothetical protein